LKSDPTIREGKGMQYYANGTVLEGFFEQNNFVKGRIIDA